jgi:hypothetical protein
MLKGQVHHSFTIIRRGGSLSFSCAMGALQAHERLFQKPAVMISPEQAKAGLPRDIRMDVLQSTVAINFVGFSPNSGFALCFKGGLLRLSPDSDVENGSPEQQFFSIAFRGCCSQLRNPG